MIHIDNLKHVNDIHRVSIVDAHGEMGVGEVLGNRMIADWIYGALWSSSSELEGPITPNEETERHLTLVSKLCQQIAWEGLEEDVDRRVEAILHWKFVLHVLDCNFGCGGRMKSAFADGIGTEVLGLFYILWKVSLSGSAVLFFRWFTSAFSPKTSVVLSPMVGSIWPSSLMFVRCISMECFNTIP